MYNEGNQDIKPEAPALIRTIIWLKLHWRTHWKLILVAFVVVSAIPTGSFIIKIFAVNDKAVHYVWEPQSIPESILVRYGSDCENPNVSHTLSASKRNLGMKVSKVDEKYGGQDLEYEFRKEPKDGINGIGYKIDLSDDKSTITWFGYGGNCGKDKLVERSATVYQCVKKVKDNKVVH